jgi:hypothetical protein
MKDLVYKLDDLNRLDEMWHYDIIIHPTGRFTLTGTSPNGNSEKYKSFDDAQELREHMYRLILNIKK